MSPRPAPTPAFVSMAFDDIPAPDFADVIVVAVPRIGQPPIDPTVWARAVFDVRSMPAWVAVLLAARQAAVRLIGVRRADSSVFEVDDVRGPEALIRQDDDHLDFRAGVAFDPDSYLLRVTTTVRIKNTRGRLYFVPVAVLHGPITRSMARAAVRRMVGS